MAGILHSCCCDSDVDCSECPSESMPLTIDVTLASITVCPCQPGGVDEVVLLAGKSVNGTYTLDQTADPCVYEHKTVDNIVRFNTYDFSDCDTLGSSDDNIISIRVKFTDNGPDRDIQVLVVVGGTFLSPTFWLFCDVVTKTNCLDAFTASNSLSGCFTLNNGCGLTNIEVHATGGTVSKT